MLRGEYNVLAVTLQELTIFKNKNSCNVVCIWEQNPFIVYRHTCNTNHD